MINFTERRLRKLQKQRHMNDIQIMILNNPLFKNLEKRDQKKLSELIYKAEMIEVFVRDKEIMRINQSFSDIVAAIADMMDDYDDDDKYDDRDDKGI